MWDEDYSQVVLDSMIRDAIECAYMGDHDDYENHFERTTKTYGSTESVTIRHRAIPTISDDIQSTAKLSLAPVTLLEHNGERLTIAQWARRIGVKKNSLQVRLMRGWTIERALTEPFAAPRTGSARRRPPKISQH